MLAEAQATARLFDSAACRAAILLDQQTRPWSSMCRSSTARTGGGGATTSPMCGLEKQRTLSSISANGRIEFIYVRNQKAASNLLIRRLDHLLGAQDQNRSDRNHHQLDQNAPHQQHTSSVFARMRMVSFINATVRSGADDAGGRGPRPFIFSVVRAPHAAALSGYLTLRDLPPLSHAAGQSSREAGMGRLFENSNGSNTCTSRAMATDHFARFLAALRAREPLGDEVAIWHAFPQAVKLNHVLAAPSDDHRYDALGRLDNLLGLVNGMRAFGGAAAPMSPAELDATATAALRHSTARSSCADVDWQDPRVRAPFVELYHADHVCFNYSSS
jgi:hypothetical protein